MATYPLTKSVHSKDEVKACNTGCIYLAYSSILDSYKIGSSNTPEETVEIYLRSQLVHKMQSDNAEMCVLKLYRALGVYQDEGLLEIGNGGWFKLRDVQVKHISTIAEYKAGTFHFNKEVPK